MLLYWDQRWSAEPDLSQFASDYCSAPSKRMHTLYHKNSYLLLLATSIDTERLFSEGRHKMNFMQHNMSHNTFKASMALGSWVDAPFFNVRAGIEALMNQISVSGG